MDVNHLHKIELKDGVLILDGLELKGVTNFDIRKSSATQPTELYLKLIVED
ncbi:hypothetical protein [Paenibacillus apiarius]|uniref:hypothetical protein n=1 Tax=Paenibacillus apiarius TaxID=46240 RepID=UPI003B3B89C7